MDKHSSEIVIVTDSTCNLPRALIEEHQIVIVPLYVLWGQEQLLDGQEIDSTTFYARLERDPVHPTTSQPTPADFARAIERTGAGEVVVITISRALSGTYESALGAAAMVDMPVHVVDSFSLSMGLGWQVLAAARERDKGGGVQQIISEVQSIRNRLSFLLTVDTLEYLHRGGRIGGAAKLVGSLIQLKPLLGINHTTGTLEAVERIRTRKKALRRLVDETFRRVDPDKPTHVAIVHAAAIETAQSLEQEIAEKYKPAEIVLTEITPVLGVHGGPGLVGICAYHE
jgi:DegV family protein with EDD domain